MSQPYDNKSLFSDYYLEELVAEDAHWQTLKKVVWEHRQRIADIMEKAVPGLDGDTPEGEVERRLIRPVLDSLGHIYFAQPSVPSPEGVRRPDYAFFPSTEARQEAESHKGQLEFFKTALAIGDAKAWDRSLDRRSKGPGDPFTNHNPSYQIDFYLRSTDRRWGLLTNGRRWRLYHRDLSYRLDVYYEVNLPQAVTLDEDTFLYFLVFFHKEAFQPDGTGECFLDRAYRSSTEYASKVSEELEDNVYEALRLLAEGLLAFPGNNLKPQDLDLVRENAFILIYRLLFVLYAEARGFLPAANPDYWGNYSLRALARDIEAKEPFDKKLHPTTTGYWSRLQDLFKLINNGDDFLRIPPYNGRLFDDRKEHQCLATWKIGDRYLAGAIDQLARAKAAGRTGRGFVSYRELSIRELGSIYEGLLEHHPRFASQDVAVVKEDEREKFVILAELGNRKPLKRYQAGSVYLETDKGERKATGSYYTPDYIVKYIVSNTLGPLLEEAKESGANLTDSILSLRVLDPAMGSGHFLVEATDYLARALVEALGGDPREMEEDEIRWARREVVERCIYGVDLNALAVDLAKLSLWLSTVSLSKPLNFLDHHLRCGNSLIGARLDDLGILPEMTQKKKQKPVTTLAGYQFKGAIAAAVSTFQQIAQAPSNSVEDIHRKESAYETARYALSQIKAIADVWTSTYFGNEVRDKDAYERLLYLAESDSANWPKTSELPWLNRARAISQERCFFHWELEFPEVFFDRNGQRLQTPGFSAVVGNPPYAILGNYGEFEPYFSPNYQSAQYKADYYMLFVEKGLTLIHPGGFLSQIFPNKFCLTTSGKGLRQFLVKHRVEAIVDFGTSQVFEDVINYVMIPIIRHCAHEPREYMFRYRRCTKGFERTVAEFDAASQSLSPHGWQFAPATSRSLLEKIELYADTLEDLAESIFAGVQTGADRIMVVKRTEALRRQLEFQLLRKFLRGRNIDRYEITWEDGYLIYPYDAKGGLLSEDSLRLKYPRIWDYLKTHEADLRQRIWFGKDAEEISGAWHGLMYFPGRDLFDRAKLLCPYLSQDTSYSVDEEGSLFGVGAGYGIFLKGSALVDRFYVLCQLNSKLCSYRFKQISPEFQAGHKNNEVYIKQLPIRRINFTTPQAERQRLVEQGKNLHGEYLQSKDWGRILSFLGDRLPRKPNGSLDTEREQSDIVHDLLACLAEEMTGLHKEKQVETKGFLTWLEGHLGVRSEEMKSKTKVKEYWKREVGWESLLSALKQNRKTIQAASGIDVTCREPQETIRSEFDASLAKLRPLAERINLTDKLIDQVVYKLYGLAEEEIAVVEGQLTQQS